MATDLFVISNIKLSKEEVLEQKEEILQKLKNLNYNNFLYPQMNQETKEEEWVMREGDWEYTMPTYWDEKTKSYLPGTDCRQVIYFSGAKTYRISVYENCLVLDSIARYNSLYYLNHFHEPEDIYNFRKEIHLLIEIFGGSEIIFLADNCCDKISDYLVKALQGNSYESIKNEMLADGTPIERDYLKLEIERFNYSNIVEYVMDDLEGL